MLIVIITVIFFSHIVKKREITFGSIIKILSGLLLGLLILWMTVPSLKHVITKDFIVVNSKCTIEFSSSGRNTSSVFNMLQTDEQFDFNKIPELKAYGQSIPYYCEVTVTKDRMWTSDYKIFDFNTRELIDSYTN